MNCLDQYILQFSGLNDGLHQFEYSVNGEFFREFGYHEISDCNMSVQIEVNKRPDMLEMRFVFSGYVVCECDRCLEEYNQPISGNERLVVKFGETTDEAIDDIIVLPSHEHQISLSQYIYESIVLMLPPRRVHPEDENGKSDCDPEIIKKLNELANLKNTDPRWDDLKNITLKN
jgi:uncharacterized protein